MPFNLSSPASFSYYLLTAETTRPDTAVGAFRDWLLRQSAAER